MRPVVAGAVPRKNGYGHYSSSIGGRSPSLKWPHLYDILRAKGYDKEKAARISNSRIHVRKNGRLRGLSYKNADNPRALKNVLKTYERKKKRPKAMAAALIAACHDEACAPPPVGKGGSSSGSGGSVPIGDYGIRYDRTGQARVSSARRADAEGRIDWSRIPVTTLKRSEFGRLVANEATVKQASIDKVVSGREPFREGYVVKLMDNGDGRLDIMDGHHRVAMHAALDRDMAVQVYSRAAQAAQKLRTTTAQVKDWSRKPLPEPRRRVGLKTPALAAALIAACHSPECAPPPAGRGGSLPGGKGSPMPGGKGSGMLRDPKKLAAALVTQTKSRTITVKPSELTSVLDVIAGDKAMMLDLGKVQVAGTHLFARVKGKIDRKHMPQIPDDHRETFIKELQESGIEVTERQVDPKQLKPTQSNFAGPKVGKMLKEMRVKGWFGAPILITSDGFILDGHHRWAAKAMQAFEKAGVRMPVTQIGASIQEVMKFGLEFDKRHGIPLQDLSTGV